MYMRIGQRFEVAGGSCDQAMGILPSIGFLRPSHVQRWGWMDTQPNPPAGCYQLVDLHYKPPNLVLHAYASASLQVTQDYVTARFQDPGAQLSSPNDTIDCSVFLLVNRRMAKQHGNFF